jgi:hypothetical protein
MELILPQQPVGQRRVAEGENELQSLCAACAAGDVNRMCQVILQESYGKIMLLP